MKVKYYLSSSGRSPVEEFILALPKETRLEIADAVALLESGRRIDMPLSRNLSSVRPGLHDKAGQVRIIYFIKRGEAIYFVHALRKKTQALPSKEIDLILKRIREI